MLMRDIEYGIKALADIERNVDGVYTFGPEWPQVRMAFLHSLCDGQLRWIDDPGNGLDFFCWTATPQGYSYWSTANHNLTGS